MKRNAFLYARVSTTSDEQQTSFETQTKYKSDEFNILSVFADKGTGTKVLNRKNFCDMLYRVGIDIKVIDDNIIFSISNRPPEVNLILVSHSSRFMRNQLLMKSLLNSLKALSVEVIFLDMGKSSFDTDIDFVMNILFLLDEQESKNTSKKVQVGLEKARKQRQYLHPGNGGIFGFDYIKEANSFIKNSESPIISYIFCDYTENNLSIRDLAKKYNMTPDKIRRILLNERYAGYNAYQKYEDNGSTLKQNYHIFKSDRIEPIITKETYDKAQQIRLSRKNSDYKGKNNNKYSLTGKIYCANCHKVYYHKAKNKRVGDTWCCLTKQNGGDCCNPNINEDKIVYHIALNINRYKQLTEQLINYNIENIKLMDKDTIEANLSELNNKKELLLDLYLNQQIDKDSYTNRFNKLSEDINYVSGELSKAINTESSVNTLTELKSSYMARFEYLNNILNTNSIKILDEVSEIIIGKSYNETSDTIEPTINNVVFKGFEKLADIDTKWNATKFY